MLKIIQKLNLRSIKFDRKRSLVVLFLILPFGLVANVPKSNQQLFKTMTGTQGCVIERLTSEAYDEFQHQGVSADGRWLAVGWNKGKDKDGDPDRGSYLLNLETGEKKHLAEPINHNSSFSPDGKFLIGAQYTSDGKTELYEYDINTDQAKVIAADPNWDFLPSYSPDGRFIVFNSYRSGNSEIYLYNRADKKLTQLTDHENYDAHGEISPDGSKVLYNRQVEKIADGLYDFDLYSYDLATGKETRMTSKPLEEGYGAWAPDSKRVVFSFNPDAKPGVIGLYIMEPDGSLKQLTGGNWKDSYAYWLRDGSYIYFNSDRSGVSQIYRVKMDGFDCVKST